MNDYTYTPNLNTPPAGGPTWRPKRWLLGIVVLLALILGSNAISKLGSATITVVNHITGANIGENVEAAGKPKISEDPEYAMPDKDNSRLDILILGVRGKDDVQEGGLLTDTILLLSMDEKTGNAVLTSIPRDLGVRVTDSRTTKINEAYIYNGLDGTKKLYSRILGVRIDNIVVFDFNAFKAIVETLGGITVTLDKPFKETQQWGYTFSLPAGLKNLNGEQALYYVRSRYSTSDFDRSRRQMQVILAMKEKAAALNLTQDPLKALQVILTIRQHIDTDLNIFDLGTLKSLVEEGNRLANIKRYQLTTENLLYETKINGLYELLPRDNTLAHIKAFFRSILSAHPVLPTPTPANASPKATTL